MVVRMPGVTLNNIAVFTVVNFYTNNAINETHFFTYKI